MLHDNGWRVELDGAPLVHRRANVVGLSTQVPPGRHRLQLSYQPRGRQLYWPACWLLEATLISLAATAVLARGRVAQIADHEKPPILWRAA
jgi:uncharacterized membrane protein YfhO